MRGAYCLKLLYMRRAGFGGLRWLMLVAGAASAVGSASPYPTKRIYYSNFIFNNLNLADAEKLLRGNDAEYTTPGGAEIFISSFAASQNTQDGAAVDQENGIVAVFDGHYGTECCEYLTHRLVKEISPLYLASLHVLNQREAEQREDKMKTYAFARGKKETTKDAEEVIMLEDEVLYEEKWISSSPSASSFSPSKLSVAASRQKFIVSLASRINAAFASLDREFYNYCAALSEADRIASGVSGASVCVVMLSPIGVIVCNLGETKAVAGVSATRSLRRTEASEHPANAMECVHLTVEHTTSSYQEAQRIATAALHGKEASLKDKKSLIESGCLLHTPVRTTRSIGDFQLKDNSFNATISDSDPAKYKQHDMLDFNVMPYSVCLPDYCIQAYGKDVKFIIIGTEGFWRLVSGDEAVKKAANFFSSFLQDRNVAAHLVREALVQLKKQSMPNDKLFSFHHEGLRKSGLGHLSNKQILRVQQAENGDKKSLQLICAELVNSHAFREDYERMNAAEIPTNPSITNDDITVCVIVLPHGGGVFPDKHRK